MKRDYSLSSQSPSLWQLSISVCVFKLLCKVQFYKYSMQYFVQRSFFWRLCKTSEKHVNAGSFSNGDIQLILESISVLQTSEILSFLRATQNNAFWVNVILFSFFYTTGHVFENVNQRIPFTYPAKHVLIHTCANVSCVFTRAYKLSFFLSFSSTRRNFFDSFQKVVNLL